MTLADVEGIGLSILNASLATYNVLDPGQAKKWPQLFLDNCAQAADSEMADAICSSKGNPYRPSFYQDTAALADEATIAIAGYTIYDVVRVKVDGVLAHKDVATYIDRIRTDVLARTTIDKYYDILDWTIRHNGTGAICKVVAFKLNAGTIQSPDAYRAGVVAGFLKLASPKAGIDNLAGMFAGWSFAYLQAAKGGAMTMPTIEQMQMQEKAA